MISASFFITSSRARIDFSRPTNSGTIMCGKTTMSRNGRTGYRVPRGRSNIRLLSREPRREEEAGAIAARRGRARRPLNHYIAHLLNGERRGRDKEPGGDAPAVINADACARARRLGLTARPSGNQALVGISPRRSE